MRVEQGRGAFVRETPIVRRVRRIPPSGHRDSSFVTEMRRLGLDPKTDLVETMVAKAPTEIAERLNIPDDSDVLVRRRHMYASGRPLQLATSYIPLDVAGDRDIADPDTNPAALYERLAARGHRVTKTVEEIEVRWPTTEEAEFLELSDGQPVIVVVRAAHDQHTRVMDVAVNVLNGYQWRLVYEWNHIT